MKMYVGQRDLDADRCEVTVDGQPLDPRVELLELSPDGFEWGYRGAAAGQFALALLADATGDNELALSCYKKSRDHCVASLGGEWLLSEATIRVWVAAQLGKELATTAPAAGVLG